MSKDDSRWLKMAHNDSKWLNTWQKYLWMWQNAKRLTQNCIRSQWLKMTQNDSRWLKMTEDDSKWLKMTQNI